MIFSLVAKWIGTGVLLLIALVSVALLGAWVLDCINGPVNIKSYEPDDWVDHPRSK